MSAAAWNLLDLCRQGFSLATATAVVMEEYPDFILEQWLPVWFEETVICGFILQLQGVEPIQ